MESIRELYKIGNGPSSSHTMGPSNAAKIFKKRYPNCKYKVTLYGSLAATGKGHLTDKVIYDVLGINNTEVVFNPELVYKYHPNGMLFEAFNNNEKLGEWLTFSVGGGSLKELGEDRLNSNSVYPHHLMKDILEFTKENNMSLADYVYKFEDNNFKDYLKEIYQTMKVAIKRGLYTEGVLPGGLNVERKAPQFYNKYIMDPSREKLVYAATLAVSEENASGGIIVTAPTCGASGVVPGVLYTEEVFYKKSLDDILDALAVGGLIGNLVKHNASISGAEVGCQGEVGVACSMAAAMVAYLRNASSDEIEYASEIGLEHHLGLTCDPVDGLVQIPCIERNAISATEAYNCALYAILNGNKHHVLLDDVISVMEQTGKDLQEDYRETSRGGLAKRKRG